MKRNWTRRKFLETSFRGSLVVGTAVAGIGPPAAGAAGFRPGERALLRAAMDEIIPAGDGMPAASAVGGLEYLDRLASQIPEIQRRLARVLVALEEFSRKRFRKGFARLSHEERVATLAGLEKQAAPHFFRALRDYVYEAYYTQPQVWKLLGYEFHATDQPGPRMKPFDEAVLAQVRKMPKLYREVG